MSRLIYIIVVLLIVAWIVVYLRFDTDNRIHILLLLAFGILIYRILYDARSLNK